MTPIRTKEEYKAALARVDELRARSQPEEAEELAQLLELIAYYKKGIIFLKEGTIFEGTISLDFSTST
jgi:predicted house-cleaning noncanonical NTP pyrophosphatase (MazG superfamily)